MLPKRLKYPILWEVLYQVNLIAYLRCVTNKKFYQNEKLGMVHGVTVSSFGEGGEEFLSNIQRAINLVLEIDQRRFSRLVSNVHYVVDDALVGGAMSASYLFREKAVRIDYDPKLNPFELDKLTIRLAGILIHEATHGYLFSKLRFTSWKKWQRCEILCLREENRFYRKVEESQGGIRSNSFQKDLCVLRHKQIRKLSLLNRWKAVIGRFNARAVFRSPSNDR